MLVLQCPQTQLLLAHSFGPKFAQAVMFAVLAKYPSFARNAWLELSAIAPMFAGGPFAEQIAWVCRNHGLDRVIWGSDYPLYTPDEAADAMCALGFDEAEQDQVMRANAEALFSL